MHRNQPVKIFYRLCLVLLLICCGTLTASAAELTQRDWMTSLVDAAGWSFGLPDEPQDPDYINILNGNRDLRFEAEDVYDTARDSVSFMSFRNFGDFSGNGWLNGSRQASDVHLNILLPVDGTYLLQVRIRRGEHHVSVGGKVVTVTAEEMFTSLDIGTFQMQAGPQEITVTLPPGGSIDYISLRAPNLPSISPADGWQPDEPLTWETVQTTMAQLMQLAEVCPTEGSPQLYEAELLRDTEANVVDIPHLGTPSNGKWLRAGPTTVDVTFPLSLKKSGFYDLAIRVMGDPVTISVGGHQSLILNAKAYLDNYTYPALFFFAGKNDISVTIPPGGGVDWLSLTARKVTPGAVMTLLGLDQSGQPDSADIDTLTTLLASFGVKR